MLVLSRKIDETIHIDGGILIKVLRITGNVVKIGILAPDHINVRRGELPARRAGRIPKPPNGFLQVRMILIVSLLAWAFAPGFDSSALPVTTKAAMASQRPPTRSEAIAETIGVSAIGLTAFLVSLADIDIALKILVSLATLAYLTMRIIKIHRNPYGGEGDDRND